MSDDLPTVPMNQPGTPAGAARGPDGPRRSRTPLIVMSVIAGLLLIAVVVLLTLLLSGRLGPSEPTAVPSSSTSEEPSPSPEPSDEPSDDVDATTEPTTEPTETSAPPPPPPAPPPATGPTFTAFSPANNTSVGCAGDSGSVPLTFTWNSTGATEAAIGVGTTDAYAGAYETGLPPSGSYSNISYQCSEATQIYTVSIRGASGQTNKTVTLKR